MTRLTPDQKKELARYCIQVTQYRGKWEPVVMYDFKDRSYLAQSVTLEDALRQALSLEVRKEYGPAFAPIPPSMVFVGLSAKYLLDHPKIRNKFEQLLNEAAQDD